MDVDHQKEEEYSTVKKIGGVIEWQDILELLVDSAEEKV
jgi:hypothetical protein